MGEVPLYGKWKRVESERRRVMCAGVSCEYSFTRLRVTFSSQTKCFETCFSKVMSPTNLST